MWDTGTKKNLGFVPMRPIPEQDDDEVRERARLTKLLSKYTHAEPNPAMSIDDLHMEVTRHQCAYICRKREEMGLSTNMGDLVRVFRQTAEAKFRAAHNEAADAASSSAGPSNA